MRLFYGLSLPEDIRRACADCSQMAQKTIEGRYLPPSNYHITLCFLGEVPLERLEEAEKILTDTAARFPAPAVTLDACDYFGRAQNGILIIRACALPSLEPIHSALAHALSMTALPVDPGPFSPHITLARHACVEKKRLPSVLPLSFMPTHAHLFLSARNAENALTYTPIFSAAFAPIP